MPGYELIGKEEQRAINNFFSDHIKKKSNLPLLKSSKYVELFEKKFANFIGCKYAICVSSGTAAIKTALVAAGVKKDDEVITQSFTYVAVLEAILAVGAKPVVTEIDLTYNMCPSDLKKKITKKTKVIMPVHMLGVAADMDKINQIAKRKKIIVIDDNCEALGARWGNNMLGNQSDMCAWSFDNGKTITTGEGGMVTTNNLQYYKLCKEYMDHGHENNPKFSRGKDTHRIYGFNFRVSELVGVIGLIQLKKIKKIININRKYSNIYKKILKKFDFTNLRKIPKKNIPLNDCVIFDLPNKRIAKNFLKELNNNNLTTKNVPDAIEWHFAKYWDHIFKEQGITKRKLLKKFPKSSKILEKSISLPIFVNEKIKFVYKKAFILEKILEKISKKI